MTYTARAEKAQERVLSAVKGAESAVVDAVSVVSERIGSVIPELPALPLSRRLPQPSEIVELSFGYWEQLLKIQKEYALGLLDAVAPITTKVIANDKPRKKARKISTAVKAG